MSSSRTRAGPLVERATPSDSELVDFFRRAQGESRKGAEQGKEMLRKRLAGS